MVLQENPKNNITFIVREWEQREDITTSHRNVKVDDRIKFTENVSAVTDNEENQPLKEADYIMLVIPVQVTKFWIEQNKDNIKSGATLVNCSKGMVMETKQFLHQICKNIFGTDQNYIALSGPSFSAEMYEKQFTMVTIAGKNKAALQILQKRLYAPHFKCFVQYDVVGVEVAGAVKNVLAIGAGYIDGLGFKFNTMSLFVTRGIKEVQHIVKSMGGDCLSLFGLSGAGDIMLSCFGGLSRNRTAGYRLAKGDKLEDILHDLGTVEGIHTLRVLNEFILEDEELKSFTPAIQ